MVRDLHYDILCGAICGEMVDDGASEASIPAGSRRGDCVVCGDGTAVRVQYLWCNVL